MDTETSSALSIEENPNSPRGVLSGGTRRRSAVEVLGYGAGVRVSVVNSVLDEATEVEDAESGLANVDGETRTAGRDAVARRPRS